MEILPSISNLCDTAGNYTPLAGKRDPDARVFSMLAD